MFPSSYWDEAIPGTKLWPIFPNKSWDELPANLSSNSWAEMLANFRQ